MNEVDKYFNDQDVFKGKMIEAYQKHTIPQWFVFHPYFDWKMGRRHCDFRIGEIQTMRNTARQLIERYDAKYPHAWDNINPENIYSGYGKDADIVCYLSNIEEELVNFLILRTAYEK